MKKTMRRISVPVIAMILIMSMQISVFAATITKQKAQNIALANAGLKASQVTRLSTETEKNSFEVELTRKKDGARFEYEITKGGKIKQIEISFKHKVNTSGKKIGKEAAQKAAAKAVGVKLSKVKAGTCKYKIDDREGIYTLRFNSGNCRYEVELLAATGKVIEIEKHY